MESFLYSLFRKESMDQLNMQDGSGEYISATTRGGWLVLVALLILVLSFCLWAFTGSLPVEAGGTGYTKNAGKNTYVFIDPDEFLRRDIDVGDKVYLIYPDSLIFEGRIRKVSSQPMSFEAISRELGNNEWVTEKVMEGDLYRYVLWIESQEQLEDMTLFNAQIIEKTVPPIEYFMLTGDVRK